MASSSIPNRLKNNFKALIYAARQLGIKYQVSYTKREIPAISSVYLTIKGEVIRCSNHPGGDGELPDFLVGPVPKPSTYYWTSVLIAFMNSGNKPHISSERMQEAMDAGMNNMRINGQLFASELDLKKFEALAGINEQLDRRECSIWKGPVKQGADQNVFVPEYRMAFASLLAFCYYLGHPFDPTAFARPMCGNNLCVNPLHQRYACNGQVIMPNPQNFLPGVMLTETP